jgi:hypothetical protein
LSAMRGIQLSGKGIGALSCHLTQSVEADGSAAPRRFRIVVKHGRSRPALNLQIDIKLEGKNLCLGLDETQLPGRTTQPPEAEPAARKPGGAPSAEELFDDLASMLKKRGEKTITED